MKKLLLLVLALTSTIGFSQLTQDDADFIHPKKIYLGVRVSDRRPKPPIKADEQWRKDPVYGYIDKNNYASYFKAFIADAKRHGLDITHLANTRLNFNIVTNIDPAIPAYADRICKDQAVRIWINADWWKRSDDWQKIQIMWHELGHDMLNLNHLKEYGHIMHSTAKNAKWSEVETNGDNPFVTVYGLLWDHPNPRQNWQRAVKDMFEGYHQVNQCDLKRN